MSVTMSGRELVWSVSRRSVVSRSAVATYTCKRHVSLLASKAVRLACSSPDVRI